MIWDCEFCGIGGLHTKEIYQCWQFHLTTRVIEKYLYPKDLRDGAIVCKNCYTFLEDKKLDHVRHMEHKEFLKKDEMKL